MEYSVAGERILATASRLFYAEGIGAIGVDRVAAESGVSKPTLYTQFESKSGLAAAVLDRRREQRIQAIATYLDELAPDTPSRVLALFDWLAIGHATPGFRGCPFTNAAAELPDPTHPARAVISEYKSWMRAMITDLAAADGLPDPPSWGPMLMLLIDGANARVLTTGDTTAIHDARTTAQALIAAAHPSQAERPSQADPR